MRGVTLAEADALRATAALCEAALMRQDLDDARRFCGRWALPSGARVRVVRVAGARVFMGNGERRWWIDVADMRRLVDGGRLRYLGR